MARLCFWVRWGLAGFFSPFHLLAEPNGSLIWPLMRVNRVDHTFVCGENSKVRRFLKWYCLQDFEQKKQRKIQKKANSKKRSLEGLVQDAVTRGDTFEDTAAASSPAVKELNGLYDNSLKAYYKEVKKVSPAVNFNPYCSYMFLVVRLSRLPMLSLRFSTHAIR